MYRIVHCADLHLGRRPAGNRGVGGSAGDSEQALRATLVRIVDLAIELDADALTVGGDLYDHEGATLDTGRFIASQFERLAPKPVLVAPGNHDPYIADSLYNKFTWPRNVVIFADRCWRPVALSRDITLWGVGHDRHGLQENLLRKLRVDGVRTNIALLHGWDLAAGPRREIAYCPFSMSDVERSGAAFVLLGHYHEKRLWPKHAPRYAYPGSPAIANDGGSGCIVDLRVDGAEVSAETIRISFEPSYPEANEEAPSGVDPFDHSRLRIAGYAAAETSGRSVSAAAE